MQPVQNLDVQQLITMAVQHHQAGRLAEAEAIYRQILAQQPDHPNALHLLGTLAGQTGRYEEATNLLLRVIVLYPNVADTHANLGEFYRQWGKLDQAVVALRRAIALKSDHLAAYNNLSAALRDRGQLEEAAAVAREALTLQPQNAKAFNNLGAALAAMGKQGEAVTAYRQALRHNPDFAEAHNNMGNVFKDLGQFDEAIEAYSKALQLAPNNALVHYNLGAALHAARRLDAAIAAYRKAIQLNPLSAQAHFNLGSILHEIIHVDEAVVELRRAIELKSDFAGAYNNLGNALLDRGDLDEAMACFSRSMELSPENLSPHHNAIFATLFHPAFDAAAILQKCREWDLRHAQPLRQSILPHDNERSPDRRLRIGYVSPDFRDHVVGRNMLPLFRKHDRTSFEIFCYANVQRPDAITARFRSLADRWRDIHPLSNAQAVAQIREDRIDILVDLALHLAGSRLMVFAHKPAPIQVTFAGYPGTTGVAAIDYRLTDPYLDPPAPPEAHDGDYTETSWRLPHSFWCYDPVAMLDSIADPPGVNPLPAMQKGYLTFGCLNNPCKVNDETLRLWAWVLHAVAGSQLLVLAQEGSQRQHILDSLAREGIASSRVCFTGRMSRREYLKQYHRIDIGLDTLPYNGHTTSLDSFWMGVPVLTLVGKTAVGRAGLSQLTNLGLTELVARTADEYVGIASSLAQDLPRLAKLRSQLRPLMKQSPLTDATGFARGVEAAYREMWRKWCSARC